MACTCTYCTEWHIPACQRCGERDPDKLFMDGDPDGFEIVPDLCVPCAAEVYSRPHAMKLLTTYPELVCIGFHTFAIPVEPDFNNP